MFFSICVYLIDIIWLLSSGTEEEPSVVRNIYIIHDEKTFLLNSEISIPVGYFIYLHSSEIFRGSIRRHSLLESEKDPVEVWHCPISLACEKK